MQEPGVGEEWSNEQHDVGKKVDYSIRQERSDRKIYLKCSDQK